MAEIYETSQELLLRGVPMHAQRAAMAAGVLPFTALGADSFSYRQADVIRWLTGESASAAAARRPSGTAPATAPAPSGRGGGGAAAGYGGSAKSQWDSLVGGLVASGLLPGDAIRQVDASHPGLRERMLQEHNRGRRDAPPALAMFKRLGTD
jgi:hypothetical protein